jgi:hypothetical protein
MQPRSLVLIALLLAGASQLAAQNPSKEFRFEDGRPLAQAATELERAYGWIITYEDVPVEGADTRDVTAEVRKDHDANAKDRVIVPNGLPFVFSVDDDQARQPGQAGAGNVIARLLDAYHQSGNPGRFQALATRSGGRLVFHLVPIERRDVRGQLVPHRSPLDTRISFPRAKRSLDRLLQTIGDTIAEASGIHVAANSAIASNYFIQTELEEGAQDEVARDVLRRVLIEDTGRPFSWSMRCESGWGCALNSHLVTVN